MGPINYAKWASMDYEDEDDEDDKPRKPRVTRLDGPARITLGAPSAPPPTHAATQPQAPAVNQPAATRAATHDRLDYSRWDSLDVDDDDDDDEEEVEEEETMPPSASANQSREDDFEDPLTASEAQRLKEVMAEALPNGKLEPVPSAQPTAAERFDALRAQLTRNGAARNSYLWRQSDREAEISVLLPAGTRARDVRPALREIDGLTGARQRLIIHRATSAVRTSACTVCP